MIVECMTCGQRVGFQDRTTKEYGLCISCYREMVVELEDKLALWQRYALRRTVESSQEQG